MESLFIQMYKYKLTLMTGFVVKGHIQYEFDRLFNH